MTPSAGTPAAAGYSMPHEGAPHRLTLMAWPKRIEAFGSAAALERAREAYAAVAQAIAGFEPVTMVADAALSDAAARSLGRGITVLPLPHDDSWMRDFGPTLVRHPDGRVAGIDWRFNAWGGKYQRYADDAQLADRLLNALAIRRIAAPLVLEGGSIHSDGAGTLLTTEQCLLNPNRNPHLSRTEIEAQLCAHLGVRRVIWLGGGQEDDETDGHVDNVACFVRPGVVLIQVTRDGADANAATAADNLARLRQAKDAEGRALEIIELPQPARRLRSDGRRLALSYVNFYLCNGGVIAPAFGDPADAEAAAILARAFPERRVVQVAALPILEGGGGIHCITQQVPG